MIVVITKLSAGRNLLDESRHRSRYNYPHEHGFNWKFLDLFSTIVDWAWFFPEKWKKRTSSGKIIHSAITRESVCNDVLSLNEGDVNAL